MGGPILGELSNNRWLGGNERNHFLEDDWSKKKEEGDF